MKKTALIFGVTGQDGSYLAKFLLSKGYMVYGTSRDARVSPFINPKKLEVDNHIIKLSVNPSDFRSVLKALTESEPQEIYNLSGQSSVAMSFEQPLETFNSVTVATANILDVIRFFDSSIRYFSAGSCDCYGNCERPAKETDAFRPRSPYAVAKASAFWQVANYRQAYNLFACTGILFNHESILRSERFVAQKIVKTACRIAKGSPEKLKLGNISIARDWGLAEEYVEAMWRMLQQDKASDYNIATGITCTLENFIDYTFSMLNLDWHDYVEFDETLLRLTDIPVISADVGKTSTELHFTAKKSVKDVIKILIEHDQNSR